jgi:putative toxin-antitoxin system antitoxin component (TIGR02293 family)
MFVGIYRGNAIMLYAKEVASILGGNRVLGRRLDNEMGYIELIREGLPIASLSAAVEALGVPEKQVLTALRISRRTVARRKTTSGRLTANESERVLRLSRAIAAATDVLGSRENAASWLQGRNLALGGISPLSLLDTEFGLQQVLDVLGRIEFGVYS